MARYFFIAVMVMFAAGGCSSKEGILKRNYKSGPIVQVEPAILLSDEVPWQTVNEYTKRKVYFNDRLTMEILEMEKSEASKDISYKHRPEDIIGYVMEGSFIVTIEKQTKQVNQGGVYIIPSNVPHSIIASTSKARVMNVYTPTREDLRPTPPEVPRFNENEIKSFVYKWFALLDEKAPAYSLRELISAQDLYMELSGVKIASPDAFEDWYRMQLKALDCRKSELDTISVAFKGKKQYKADISLVVSERDSNGMIVKKKFKESWTMIDTGEPLPKILKRIVQEMK